MPSPSDRAYSRPRRREANCSEVLEIKEFIGKEEIQPVLLESPLLEVFLQEGLVPFPLAGIGGSWSWVDRSES